MYPLLFGLALAASPPPARLGPTLQPGPEGSVDLLHQDGWWRISGELATAGEAWKETPRQLSAGGLSVVVGADHSLRKGSATGELLIEGGSPFQALLVDAAGVLALREGRLYQGNRGRLKPAGDPAHPLIDLDRSGALTALLAADQLQVLEGGKVTCTVALQPALGAAARVRTDGQHVVIAQEGELRQLDRKACAAPPQKAQVPPGAALGLWGGRLYMGLPSGELHSRALPGMDQHRRANIDVGPVELVGGSAGMSILAGPWRLDPWSGQRNRKHPPGAPAPKAGPSPEDWLEGQLVGQASLKRAQTTWAEKAADPPTALIMGDWLLRRVGAELQASQGGEARWTLPLDGELALLQPLGESAFLVRSGDEAPRRIAVATGKPQPGPTDLDRITDGLSMVERKARSGWMARYLTTGVAIFDPGTGEDVGPPLPVFPSDISVAPGGRLALSIEPGRLRAWVLATGEELWRLELPAPPPGKGEGRNLGSLRYGLGALVVEIDGVEWVIARGSGKLLFQIERANARGERVAPGQPASGLVFVVGEQRQIVDLSRPGALPALPALPDKAAELPMPARRPPTTTALARGRPMADQPEDRDCSKSTAPQCKQLQYARIRLEGDVLDWPGVELRVQEQPALAEWGLRGLSVAVGGDRLELRKGKAKKWRRLPWNADPVRVVAELEEGLALASRELLWLWGPEGATSWPFRELERLSAGPEGFLLAGRGRESFLIDPQSGLWLHGPVQPKAVEPQVRLIAQPPAGPPLSTEPMGGPLQARGRLVLAGRRGLALVDPATGAQVAGWASGISGPEEVMAVEKGWQCGPLRIREGEWSAARSPPAVEVEGQAVFLRLASGGRQELPAGSRLVHLEEQEALLMEPEKGLTSRSLKDGSLRWTVPMQGELADLHVEVDGAHVLVGGRGKMGWMLFQRGEVKPIARGEGMVAGLVAPGRRSLAGAWVLSGSAGNLQLRHAQGAQLTTPGRQPRLIGTFGDGEVLMSWEEGGRSWVGRLGPQGLRWRIAGARGAELVGELVLVEGKDLLVAVEAATGAEQWARWQADPLVWAGSL